MGNRPHLEDKLEKYWRRLFYLQPKAGPTPLDPGTVEYFGVFGITDPQAADRKLWYIYCCRKPEIPEVGERIRHKYGKKNVHEIYRRATFSGVGFRRIVKDYFSHLKWFVSGNLLEAPPKSYFNDERFVKTISDLNGKEQRRLFDYIMVQHDWFKRYNDQKPPPSRR
ncbi:uncharacterized protein LOC108022496 isoform X2 [Drosophila biarmipes]|uniref:uncharacterized protein LOC108022496 isoform X2 n=1 Tax=Drosophila biarmipes TaxID=125945 RepID=UPI0021CCF13E|nr:uncharacterized protein LOC108022496 isoform X2 [Drosophila biarmipes]